MITNLETERLLLKAPGKDNLSLYNLFYTDEEASRDYGGPLSPIEVWNRLKADLGSWYLCGFGVWVIEEKYTGTQLGTCGFWQGIGWPRELTWWLLPEARGKGIAHEASLAAINHAYTNFQWDSVETYMNDNNVPARSLVERLGGIKINRIQFPDGLYRDIYQLPKS
ncbi:GNAT family N-acetyltransferase [Microbulbifer variabilis]|uniref:GNAT family N-acetyltransferase n=1 Tax=Microbulbifer variabilis TaxID=266805 RepID=UPI001CFCB702|nr:GNAT family N-acetyltransferase [Microbulbifer variabilis]